MSLPRLLTLRASKWKQLRRQFRLNQRLQIRDEIRILWERMPILLDEDPYSAFKKRGCPYVGCQCSRHIASQQICNKLTVLYRNSDALKPFSAFSGALWKQWFYHNSPPKIDFGYYVAQSFRVTEPRLLDIPQLLTYHSEICDEAERCMRQGGQEYFDKCLGSATPERSTKNYKVLPLCRAIMTVFDGQADDIERYSDEELFLGEDIGISTNNPDGFRSYSLDRFAQKCTVVLVRTGDESQLSTPIDFSRLDQIFPLERPDIRSDSGIEAVRVTIAAAVSFLVDVQNQEMRARPEFYYNPRTDRFRNGHMVVRGTSLEYWYSSSEYEWVEACHQPDRWRDYEKRWLEDAMERVKKTQAGEKNWDDMVAQDRWILRWA